LSPRTSLSAATLLLSTLSLHAALPISAVRRLIAVRQPSAYQHRRVDLGLSVDRFSTAFERCASQNLRVLFQKRSKTGRRSAQDRSEEHTSELQSRFDLVCRLLLEKKKK